MVVLENHPAAESKYIRKMLTAGCDLHQEHLPPVMLNVCLIVSSVFVYAWLLELLGTQNV